jgi:hypothetical protein
LRNALKEKCLQEEIFNFSLELESFEKENQKRFRSSEEYFTLKIEERNLL